MVTVDGRATLSYGVMGGQYQATGHATLLTGLIDNGRDVQEAIDAPRSFHFDGVWRLKAGCMPARPPT